MKKIIILLLGILMTVSSFSKTLVGKGEGPTEAIAQKEALADLSNQIQVTVKSNFTSQKTLSNGETNNDASSEISAISETKILGVDFEVKKKWFRSKYIATATLDETDTSLYEKKADELRNKVSTNYTQALGSENLKLQRNYLMNALKSYEDFESYKNVATILGSQKIYQLPITKTEIKNKLQSVEEKMNNSSLYNGINILYIKSSGQFKDNSKDFFDNAFNSILASISKENNNKIAISNANDSTVNTLVKVVLNSNYTTVKPAVYYNKKMITPDTNITTINVTVELYNKENIENLLTITVTGEGSDEKSVEASFEKAVKNAFAQMEEKLKSSLISY